MTTSLKPFVHPLTGETLSTLQDFQRAIQATDEHMAPLYAERRLLREEMARRFEPELPLRLYRTPKQDLVTRCPRCGGRITPDEAA